MKTRTLGIIFLVDSALLAAGVVFRQTETPAPFKITDQCPDEKRAPVEKLFASITRNRGEFEFIHPVFGFRMVIPEDVRFEENTLQEYEEPISFPSYLYTLFLTYREPRDIHRMSPVETRFIVYPTLCNTPAQWQQFLETQGWKDAADTQSDVRFTVVERVQGGRTHQRYFRHTGTWHYQFELSWDRFGPVDEGLVKARSVIESFDVTVERELNETK